MGAIVTSDRRDGLAKVGTVHLKVPFAGFRSFGWYKGKSDQVLSAGQEG